MSNTPALDPMVKTATELIAAHGVYALTAICIFYQQSRAVKNLQQATPSTRSHFRTVHTTVVAATCVMMLISTTVWVYATFFYHAKVFVKGVVTDLIENHAHPTTSADTPAISQRIILQSQDADVYEARTSADEKNGTYDLSWLLLPHNQLQGLVFRFQHRYELVKEVDHSTSLTPVPGGVSQEQRTISKAFRLKLDMLQKLDGQMIQLAWTRDPKADPVRDAGQIFLRTQTESVLLPWEDERQVVTSIAPPNPLFSVLAVAHAYFAGSTQMFDAKGEYDEQASRSLRSRLGSPDLRTQLGARSTLVDGGTRSFKFVRDTLAAPSNEGYDQYLLVANIAKAVDEIGVSDKGIPSDIQLALAMAYVRLADYTAAASRYDLAGNGAIKDEGYFYRGLAYAQSEQPKKAISDFEHYLSVPRSPYATTVVKSNLAAAWHAAKDDEKAIRFYKEAIGSKPLIGEPLNNLAYLYAERGEKLQEALSLSDRALAFDKANPVYLDTKGWILHLLGRDAEALPLLTEAARAAPGNADVQKHLETVQRVPPPAPAKPPKKG